MPQSQLIANRLREVLLSGRWIANTNCKEQIESITWEQSINKVANLNTIAALVYHLNYYLAGLIHAFKNGTLEISDRFSFDMKPIESESDWDELKSEFLTNSIHFSNLIELLDDEILYQPFIDEKYGTCLRNIEGVIEHSYYHLGQISLIRKLVIEKEI